MTTVISGSSPVGYQAMMASGGGAYNSAFGVSSLYSVTAGAYNSAFAAYQSQRIAESSTLQSPE